MQHDPSHQLGAARGRLGKLLARLACVRESVGVRARASQHVAAVRAGREATVADRSGSTTFIVREIDAHVRPSRHHQLVLFAFDLLHRDGQDLRHLPLTERKTRLARLIARSEIPCLHLVEGFNDGVKLLETAERMQLEGILSKRRSSPTARVSAATGARSRRPPGVRRTGSGGHARRYFY
jgi:ATP dependent DNA ligase domain